MFLDRKPFLYLWRPFYRLVFGTEQRLARIEERLATLETATTAQSATLESLASQVRGLGAGNAAQSATLESLASQVKGLGAGNAAQSATLESLTAQVKELGAGNAAQWEAVEQLLLTLIGTARGSFAAGGK